MKEDLCEEEIALIDEQIIWIGERIRQLRQERGVSLLQLSYATGISRSQLTRLENGNGKDVRVELILKIACVLKIDICSLFLNFRMKTLPNTISDGDLFDEITTSLREEERKMILEMVRNTRSMLEHREKTSQTI